MDQPRLTPTASDRLTTESPRTSFPAFFAHKDRLARLALAVALGALLVTLLALLAATATTRRGVRFVVLDSAGNWTLAPGATFSEAKDVHVQQALLATTALLLRNPEDFDQPEILQALFGGNALSLATQLKAAEASEFHERQIHQKPQIARITAIETREDEVQLRVVGELIRSGVFEQAPFQEVIPFTLRLTLRPNPDLLRNRRQPTLISDWALSYDPPAA